MEQPTSLTPPPSLRERVLPAALFAFLCLGVAVALYSWFREIGPYRWLMALQLRYLGYYSEKLTAVLTFTLCVTPGAVLLKLLIAQGAVSPHGLTAALFTRNAPSAGYLRRARPWLIVAGVGAVMGWMSGRDLLVAMQGEHLVTMPVQALEQGKEIESTWLELGGEAMWDVPLRTEERRGDEISYVLVVSPEWEKGQKIGALLKLRTADEERLKDAPLQGVVIASEPPAMVQGAFEEEGLDVSQALLLELGESPEAKGATAKWVLGFAGILFLLGGAGALVRLRG